MEWQLVQPAREVSGGENSGIFILGQAAEAAKTLAETKAGTVRLLYVDPPFMGGGSYAFSQRVGAEGWRGENNSRVRRSAYSDRWSSPEAYIAMLREVLIQAKPLLTEDAGIFVHVDWHASAYVRLLLDEVFGAEHFVNELIWAYQSGGRSRDYFARKHDTIYFYTMGEHPVFYPDAVGALRGPQRKNHLRKGTDPDGRVYYAITVSGKEYRYYEDEKVAPTDVWTDIPVLQQRDPERTGYDTQKPLALLNRILTACTLPGDTVLDLFSGSGTCAEAAASLGRIPLAADVSPDALQLFRRRLSEHGTGFTLYGVPWEAEETAPVCEARAVQAEKGVTFALDAFSVESPDLPEAPHTLITDPVRCADHWSAGYILDGTYYALAFTARTVKEPYLEQELTVPALPDGAVPAFAVTHVLGKTACYIPTDQTL